MKNNIELKTVRALAGSRFFIPDYQRGYRWTRQQVEDLLNDIDQFHPETDGFYCLQPLVVKRREEDILLKIKSEAQTLEEVARLLNGAWEVIDGQQRLTTIYILLNCLKTEPLYTIEYDTRPDSAHFLRDIRPEQASKNIDYYHMAQAAETINTWLQKRQTRDDASRFPEQLLGKLLDQVKFIWYELADDDPIMAFSRLNKGKIQLNNAELIKALFLNRSNFRETEEGLPLRRRQQEIALQWDRIECDLQDDEFWLFLHPREKKLTSRIESLFELVCDRNALGLSDDPYQALGTDSNRTFRYFDTWFRSENADIEHCWELVNDYYQIFREWFQDLELYHYVGYLIACEKATPATLLELWLTQKTQDKRTFVSGLRHKIDTIIQGCPGVDFQYDEEGCDKQKCRPILLFHNIQTVINRNRVHQQNPRYRSALFYKFPFHLYKLENWDVEHINSNTTNPEADESTRCEWLMNLYVGASEDVRKQIKAYFEAEEARHPQLFAAIKKHFPEPEGWDAKTKNRLWNYTLLDSATNRSYGNMIFSGKRRIIIGKDQGRYIPIPTLAQKEGSRRVDEGEERAAESSFVPPCTRNVFLKYYSPAAQQNNYWTLADAAAYQEDIERTLKQLKEE